MSNFVRPLTPKIQKIFNKMVNWMWIILQLQNLTKSHKFIMSSQIEFDIFWWFWSHWCNFVEKKHNCKSLLLSAIVIVCMKYEIRQVMKSSISHLSSGDPFSETEKGFGVGPTPVGSQCTGVSLSLSWKWPRATLSPFCGLFFKRNQGC